MHIVLTHPRRALAAAAGLLAGAAPARAQQVLTLANGDCLRGTLRRVADRAWVFAYRGAEVKVPVDSIASFTAPQAIGVRLADGTVGAAVVAPTSDSLALELSLADGTRRTITPSALAAVGRPDDLAALAPVAIGWFSPLDCFWSGSGSVGFSDQRGNTTAKVYKGLGSRVEALGEYSSRPLPGIRPYDLQTRLTLTYAFGR
jgi:hypothetical protein